MVSNKTKRVAGFLSAKDRYVLKYKTNMVIKSKNYCRYGKIIKSAMPKLGSLEKRKETNKMEKKTTEVIKGAEITLKAIDLEMNPQNQDEVKRIRFKTDKGDITWKPKVNKTQLLDGMKLLKTVPMSVSDLPKKLSELGSKISEEGHVKMKVQYTKMVAVMDGVENEYRFITSGKTFEGWQILSTTPQEDQVL